LVVKPIRRQEVTSGKHVLLLLMVLTGRKMSGDTQYQLGLSKGSGILFFVPSLRSEVLMS